MVSQYFWSLPQLTTDTWNTDEKTSALLELYGIPSTAGMFLHDKKMAYLRFVGAGRALKHLVLD
jgi:hypothetical protein